MYAFYNPTTKKYMYYYPYSHYDDGFGHSLDRDSTEILFVHHERTVLQNILDNYNNRNYGSGSSIQSVEVEIGFLDGFEIIQLGHI